MAQLNSARTRRGISVVLLIVVVSILVAAMALKSMRNTAREHVAGKLSQMVESTYTMMQFRDAQRRLAVEGWAKVPEFVELTTGLVSQDVSPQALSSSPAQGALRHLVGAEISQQGFDNYYLVDRTMRILATMHDDASPRIGERLASKTLQAVLDGNTGISLSRSPASGSSIPMFVAAPVRDASGHVIAALAFRLAARSDFSSLVGLGQTGTSGETYLIDADARMLSGSRFESALIDAGLIQAGQSSILNVRMIDPGKNLLQSPGLPDDYEKRPLTRMAAAMVEGRSGLDLGGYRDYRGVPVVGYWRWYPEKGYGVVAEIDVDEAYQMYASMRTTLFGVLLAMILVFMAMVSLMEVLNRRAAEVICSSEARYRQLLNLMPDAITVQHEGRISYCNPAAVRMFGASSPDDLIDRPLLNLVHAGDRSRVQARIAEAGKDSGEQRMQEERLLRMDGDVFVAEMESCGFADADGVDSVLIVARDISLRKQIEEERERLRIAVEQTSEGIIITDAQGKILYVNPGAAGITGRSLSKLSGMYEAEARGGRLGDELYRTIDACLNKGESWHGEFSLQHPDGTTRIIDRRTSPVLVDGETHYHVSVDRDITEERRQQEHMEHTQRLESLGVLAGGIAHDFNNILAAIMGNASMAGKKFGDLPEAHKHLVRIEGASQRAAELCRQMLAYSGKGRFVVRPVNLSLMLKDIAKLLDVSVTKFAELDVDLAPELPAVQADATQMQQVIMNLVINASDAIGEQAGRISLRTGIVHAKHGELEQSYTGEMLAEGDYVFLEVSDTGCGMSEETRKKLFDPFFTTKFTGRGLGMSAVLGIVRGHHGAIVVESEEGVGSCFRVLLPALTGAVGAGVESQDESIEWCPSGTVLVVDDEEIVRETAAMMLEDIGFKTLKASDGEEAVAMYRERGKDIALVLLDMTMPRMDGRSCFVKLREMAPDVCVVLSSGYNEQDATTTFADEDLAGFVQKPYRLASLQAKLREALEAQAAS